MLSLKEVFDQAALDNRAASIKTPGYWSITRRNAKIVKDISSGDVILINSSKMMDEEVTDDEVKIFLKFGWKSGVYSLTLFNYRSKLNYIDGKIKDSINSNKSQKSIKDLKSKRDTLMAEYTQLNSKLNDSKKESNNI